MSKIGRNDPCPCGSGKKYKHCCVGKIIEMEPSPNVFPSDQLEKYKKMAEKWDSDEPIPTFNEMMGKPNLATKELHRITQTMGERVFDFDSMDELNHFAMTQQNQINHAPLAQFLGLSPEQMSKILYLPLDQNKDIIHFTFAAEQNELKATPIMVKALYFLEQIKNLEPLKATPKGNLPRKVVRDLYYQVFKNYQPFNHDINPMNEDDVQDITITKSILLLGGFIKKVHNKYSLTHKSRNIIEKQDFAGLYKNLFLFFVEEFDWASVDRFGIFPIIQDSFIFELYILKQKAKNDISGKVLGDIFFNAFPVKDDKESYIFGLSPKDLLVQTFCINFLDRFCVNFGLLDMKREGELWEIDKTFYKTLPLFDKLFQWMV